MSFIPLIKGKHLGAFVEILDEAGAPIDRLILSNRLPGRILEKPDNVFPILRFFAFCNQAARSEGIRNLGLLAGQKLQIPRFGRVGRIIMSMPTLLSAIQKYCELIKSESSNVLFTLTEIGDRVRFSFESVVPPAVEHFQTEIYKIQIMLNLMHLASPGWWPDRIFMEVAEPPEWDADVAEQLGGVEVRFGSDFSGFFIPRPMMALRVSSNGFQEISNGAPGRPDHEETIITAPALDFADSLRQVVETYRGDSWLTIDEAAEVVDMSVRTLQRRLAEEKQSYSGLLGRVRFEAAIPMLQDPHMEVIDIAYKLGYSDPAHFTRAFRRWAGVTPREFRQNRASAAAN